jgi:thioredoxin-related protein
MKNFKVLTALLVLLSFGLTASAANLPAYFATDFDAAKNSPAEKKYILAIFSTSWCGPCQAMVKDIYPQKEVEEGLKEYASVYIDGDKNKALTQHYKIEGFPTFIVMNKDGKEYGRFSGGMPSSAMFLKEVENAKNQKEIKEKQEKELADLDAKIKSTPSIELYVKRAEMKLAMKDFKAVLADYGDAAKLDTDNKTQVNGDFIFWTIALSGSNDVKLISTKLEEVVGKYPKCKSAIQAQLVLINLYGGPLKQTDKAIKMAEGFIAKYPEHAAVPGLQHNLQHLKGIPHVEPH